MGIDHNPANATVIDAEGFRANVGIIVSDADGRLLLARRVGHPGWQFPQGGLQPREEPEQALYRELHEEVGLTMEQVRLLGKTQGWLRYELPPRYQRRTTPLCIGQKQLWYMLRLETDDSAIRLDCSDTPEFDAWRWVDYWQPLNEVIFFKRRVYREALTELAPLVFPAGAPPMPAIRRNGRRRRSRR